ncbi:hypothetical protein G210_3670 [Candida maltosa Xu316]|uniref:Uncharacterized protein n=1 Tax=Candida maltosa (strain Xu316) TaxID=1245528 RepID=M3J2M0_CANMX|nr:hypothetical protein G210_3670 [Candida maltosa Xu316]
MSNTNTEIIPQARAFLSTSQPEKALEILLPFLESEKETVEYLSILGETFLENNELEKAYETLSRACELDPECDKGFEKFLYLGQIIGGEDGLNYINIALNKLSTLLNSEDNTKQHDKSFIINKLNSGIFSEIEIWMTDLCMEEEAENKCNELIEHSLGLDNNNPEAYSLLSSIRISQQRDQEAIEALNKSWELFQLKKTRLEEMANKKPTGDKPEDDEEQDSFEIGMEYVELIQPLITLSRYAIELEQYDQAIQISLNIQDINDNILDAYYIESLANIFKCKKIIDPSNENYKDIELGLVLQSTNEEVQSIIQEVKSSLTSGYKIINSDVGEEFDGGLIEQMNQLINELGGPVMSELMPSRRSNKDEEDEEGWEDEIVSDDE